MSKRHSSNENNRIRTLDLKDIDPSPYQRRKFFDVDRLKELAASIQREGLIAPILVRPIGRRYELIAGERRFQAIRDHTNMQTIQAMVVISDDLKALRTSADENFQREDLTVFETLETVVGIVDAELVDDKEYASMGKTPVDRVRTLLGRLDSVRSSRKRGSKVASMSKPLFHRLVEQVEQIFRNLPNPLEWRSFYIHDLPLLTDICGEIRQISIQHDLSKSQTSISQMFLHWISQWRRHLGNSLIQDLCRGYRSILLCS